ncbi:MAG TPA: bifunctional nuclease family protein [Candidatus Hydrogenedentes bacterium]|nr:bifunctional nuclease family protein [Candidatus Hydrogenedentota bacterium]HOS01641.1 bifunctional nuclease family protein [Candidatus Hydrogenedentota bacterium]
MIELEVLGIHSDGQSAPLVLLRHEERLLPIVVGFAEADAIHAALTHRDLGRPMTHDLICNILAGLQGVLRSVTIYKLENDTFYAYLSIEQVSGDGDTQEVLRVDARPSDSIAIALRVEAPIFVAEEVLEKAGQDISTLGTQEDDEEGESSEFDA